MDSIMACVLRSFVFAFGIGVIVISQSTASFAKDGKDVKSLDAISTANSVMPTVATEFHWDAHRKLTWDDFRGSVNAVNDESAAATHCGIGFKTSFSSGKPAVVVYNTFYVNKSWVRADAHIPTILVHEQGHFDLCEIYTRKLRERMKNFDFNVPDVRQQLLNIYNEVSDEYETRQQAYEQQTVHGTNFAMQKKWQDAISKELL